MLRSIYPDVDFAGFHFNRHLLGHLHSLSAERYKIVERELQEAWKARMEQLTQRLSGQILLMCIGECTPENAPETSNGPMYVNHEMLDFLSEHVTETIEIVLSSQAQAAGCEGMVFTELEAPAAREIMGPAAHREVKEALLPVLRRML